MGDTHAYNLTSGAQYRGRRRPINSRPPRRRRRRRQRGELVLVARMPLEVLDGGKKKLLHVPLRLLLLPLELLDLLLQLPHPPPLGAAALGPGPGGGRGGEADAVPELRRPRQDRGGPHRADHLLVPVPELPPADPSRRRDAHGPHEPPEHRVDRPTRWFNFSLRSV